MFGYNETDVEATLELYRETRTREIKAEIEELYNRIDMCDDIWIREKFARKVKRLQAKLNEL